MWRILFVRALMPWMRKYRRRVGAIGWHPSTHGGASGRNQGLELEIADLRRENLALRQRLQGLEFYSKYRLSEDDLEEYFFDAAEEAF
jgi:hypothetical protein